MNVWRVYSKNYEVWCATADLADKWRDALELEAGFGEKVLVHMVLVREKPPARGRDGKVLWNEE